MTKTLNPPVWTGVDAPFSDKASVSQVAALCWRDGKDGREVLLVKSSRGRWILPKGWPMDDRTDAQAAKLEAWEEAGVKRGKVAKVPIGGFVTEKRFDDGTTSLCHVSVFEIGVKEMTSRYPEAGLRQRKWMPVKKAIKKVDDAGLKAFLKRL